ncbi:hypothetical protein CXG81DRAFT_19308 [Caulochytrium protostelioides]|uniref:Uncharacterized protein n=1 Tax=Caulochytrium protostelioides TaxID=1555241 RepID=A0A4P9X6J8_9FUNG|nr:hypothetical protein CXG81DRAFT_19308 [Caulochytrium protostelioides]|eukprot:RKP00803.1 hypothetical protein CXG81DRAFT_19308 [Caulochytrium protostelioides]
MAKNLMADLAAVAQAMSQHGPDAAASPRRRPSHPLLSADDVLALPSSSPHARPLPLSLPLSPRSAPLRQSSPRSARSPPASAASAAAGAPPLPPVTPTRRRHAPLRCLTGSPVGPRSPRIAATAAGALPPGSPATPTTPTSRPRPAMLSASPLSASHASHRPPVASPLSATKRRRPHAAGGDAVVVQGTPRHAQPVMRPMSSLVPPSGNARLSSPRSAASPKHRLHVARSPASPASRLSRASPLQAAAVVPASSPRSAPPPRTVSTASLSDATLDAQLQKVKWKLKEWERRFVAAYGRPPALTDVDALPEIAATYRTHSKLRRELKRRQAAAAADDAGASSAQSSAAPAAVSSPATVPASAPILTTEAEAETPVLPTAFLLQNRRTQSPTRDPEATAGEAAAGADAASGSGGGGGGDEDEVGPSPHRMERRAAAGAPAPALVRRLGSTRRTLTASLRHASSMPSVLSPRTDVVMATATATATAAAAAADARYAVDVNPHAALFGAHLRRNYQPPPRPLVPEEDEGEEDDAADPARRAVPNHVLLGGTFSARQALRTTTTTTMASATAASYRSNVTTTATTTTTTTTTTAAETASHGGAEATTVDTYAQTTTLATSATAPLPPLAPVPATITGLSPDCLVIHEIAGDAQDASHLRQASQEALLSGKAIAPAAEAPGGATNAPEAAASTAASTAAASTGASEKSRRHWVAPGAFALRMPRRGALSSHQFRRVHTMPNLLQSAATTAAAPSPSPSHAVFPAEASDPPVASLDSDPPSEALTRPAQPLSDAVDVDDAELSEFGDSDAGVDPSPDGVDDDEDALLDDMVEAMAPTAATDAGAATSVSGLTPASARALAAMRDHLAHFADLERGHAAAQATSALANDSQYQRHVHAKRRKLGPTPAERHEKASATLARASRPRAGAVSQNFRAYNLRGKSASRGGGGGGGGARGRGHGRGRGGLATRRAKPAGTSGAACVDAGETNDAQARFDTAAVDDWMLEDVELDADDGTAPPAESSGVAPAAGPQVCMSAVDAAARIDDGLDVLRGGRLVGAQYVDLAPLFSVFGAPYATAEPSARVLRHLLADRHVVAQLRSSAASARGPASDTPVWQLAASLVTFGGHSGLTVVVAATQVRCSQIEASLVGPLLVGKTLTRETAYGDVVRLLQTCHVVIVTPERLQSDAFLAAVQTTRRPLALAVIDAADHYVPSHPQYRFAMTQCLAVLRHMPAAVRPAVLALASPYTDHTLMAALVETLRIATDPTASTSEAAVEVVTDAVADAGANAEGDAGERATPTRLPAALRWHCDVLTEDVQRDERLMTIVDGHTQRNALVLTAYPQQAEQVASRLRRHGIDAETYHGQKGKSQNDAAARQFGTPKCRCLVATTFPALRPELKLHTLVQYALPRGPDAFTDAIAQMASTVTLTAASTAATGAAAAPAPTVAVYTMLLASEYQQLRVKHALAIAHPTEVAMVLRHIHWQSLAPPAALERATRRHAPPSATATAAAVAQPWSRPAAGLLIPERLETTLAFTRQQIDLLVGTLAQAAPQWTFASAYAFFEIRLIKTTLADADRALLSEGGLAFYQALVQHLGGADAPPDARIGLHQLCQWARAPYAVAYKMLLQLRRHRFVAMSPSLPALLLQHVDAQAWGIGDLSRSAASGEERHEAEQVAARFLAAYQAVTQRALTRVDAWWKLMRWNAERSKAAVDGAQSDPAIAALEAWMAGTQPTALLAASPSPPPPPSPLCLTEMEIKYGWSDPELCQTAKREFGFSTLEIRLFLHQERALLLDKAKEAWAVQRRAGLTARDLTLPCAGLNGRHVAALFHGVGSAPFPTALWSRHASWGKCRSLAPADITRIVDAGLAAMLEKPS